MIVAKRTVQTVGLLKRGSPTHFLIMSTDLGEEGEAGF